MSTDDRNHPCLREAMTDPINSIENFGTQRKIISPLLDRYVGPFIVKRASR